MTRPIFYLAAFCSAALLGCGASEDASMSKLVGTAPLQIDSVQVEVDSAGLAMLTASASEGEGTVLLYNWGSRGLSPPVVSESQVVLDSAHADPGQVTAHLVVQDETGTLASAKVVFTPGGTCRLCGSYSVTNVPITADEPCVALHDRCVAACRNDSNAATTCLDECAVALTLCRVDPA